MTTDEQAALIIAQLSTATDYTQADQILSAAEKEHQLLFKDILTFLQEKIENLSPLDCNSSQWSIYRYALMCIRRHAMMEPA